MEEEEEEVDLKMNSTLFVPEQSISGGGVGAEGGGYLKNNKINLLLKWQITWKEWGGRGSPSF